MRKIEEKNKSNKKGYSIGLDIGTASVGYAVVDENNRIITRKFPVRGNTDKKFIKKNMIGSLLFESADTAEDRRLKRTARRRFDRRKKRLLWLQEIFAEEMSQVDENFFMRLEDSFLVPEDKRFERHPIFKNLEEEKEYHKNFPTIYHLRKDLADINEKKDLRLVYLGLAHIIKYRGHFLFEGNLESENTSTNELFSKFIDEFNNVFSDREKFKEVLIPEDFNIEIILQDKISKTGKLEKLIANLSKDNLLKLFLRIIIGLESDFKKEFDLEESFKLKIAVDDYEEKIETLLAQIGDEYAEIFALAKLTHDAAILADILSGATLKTKAKISSSMINRFEEHKKDLEKLKIFIKENLPKKYRDYFKDSSKNGYAGYIEGKTKESKFYKFTESLIDNIDGSNYFIDKIKQENFLRKQRTYDNGVIPNQIHLKELQNIIENQGQYYPFLLENKEKIEKLLTFRIPYYVGPLAKKGQSQFAWLERKTDETIRPWNFYQVVDEASSAEKFITRMTNNCQYLPEEKVLPRKSLIYEKYTIFNELTKVGYERDGLITFLSTKQKSEIFETLFKKQVKVKEKDIENFLINNYNLSDFKVKGMDEKFNASYTTYHDLKKLDSIAKIIDSPDYENILEDIIKTLTVFDDRKIIKHYLGKYSEILSEKDINALSKKKYNGWGRLSYKLINGIRDEVEGKTILDFLIDDEPYNRNLMQLINSEDLLFREIIDSSIKIEYKKNFSEIVSEIPGSPAIKKGILNSLKIVEEIINIMGGESPRNIVIEMAREFQPTNKVPQRLKKLEEGIKKLEEELNNKEEPLLKKHPTDNKKLQSEKLYLYYLQHGKDMYQRDKNGSPLALDINNLSFYDVDHIIPQSILKDDSIDNKVLTSSKTNRGMSDNVPSKEIVEKMKPYWEKLYKAGLISQRKFLNLTKAERGGLSEDDKVKFINRQLVETRQITKYVASILDNKFNSSYNEGSSDERTVNIITLKAEMTSRFRKTFELYKVRELNDLHHAHDAYLGVVVANSLLNAYPKLSAEFVYGDYRTYANYGKEAKADKRREIFNNILKFFDNKATEEQIAKNKKFDKNNLLKYVEKIIYQSQINVVKKTEVQKGGFSKETIQPKGNSDKLIPRKTKQWVLSPEKYGGFDSPVVAYTVAVVGEKIDKPRKTIKEFVGITIMHRSEFESNPQAFLRKYNNFSEINKYIILPKYSLFVFENGRRRLLASARELQKGNQFTFSKSLMDNKSIPAKRLIKLLYYSIRYDEVNNSKLSEWVRNNANLFEEIIEFINKYADKNILADANKKKINDLYSNFDKKDISLLAESMVNLLTFTSMGAPAAFKFLEENIDRKRYTSTTECWGATLINQSITGLYETRIDLSKLTEE